MIMKKTVDKKEHFEFIGVLLYEKKKQKKKTNFT